MGRKKKKDKILSMNLYTGTDESGAKIFEVSLGVSALREIKNEDFAKQPKFGPFADKDELMAFIRKVGEEEGFTHFQVKPVSLEAIKKGDTEDILCRRIHAAGPRVRAARVEIVGTAALEWKFSQSFS